jgi:hypothetical protein
MLSCDEGSFQAHWLNGCRSISVAGSARGRDLDLRQQIDVLWRTALRRLSFSVFDRLVFVGLYRLFSKDLRRAGGREA